MTDKEVMQMALDALDYVGYVYTTEEENQEVEQAIEALRTALAQPEQEELARLEQAMIEAWKPIPKKEWVGLTDEEIMSLLPGAVRLPPGWADTVRAIEAKLKEKNND